MNGFKRNICAREWILSHPCGTTAEFKEYYDNLLSPADRKVCLLFTVRNLEAKYIELKKYEEQAARMVSVSSVSDTSMDIVD